MYIYTRVCIRTFRIYQGILHLYNHTHITYTNAYFRLIKCEAHKEATNAGAEFQIQKRMFQILFNIKF